ncbi:hypothetical protein ARMGADRAFT_1021729 [Armillaria gallica]|uniref:Uncharacterized protein n=1 Tax=Armillaria gallica TaxID=47427 RepID=A0A2H3CB43_ARMGA|nr:hypothetical protein ARMGADRAFT_1021729 [Armillaria gallica]
MIREETDLGLGVRVLIGGNLDSAYRARSPFLNDNPLCKVELERTPKLRDQPEDSAQDDRPSIRVARRLMRLMAIRVGARMDGCGVGAIKGGVPDDETGLLLDRRCGRAQLETRRWQGGACLTESQKGRSRRWTEGGGWQSRM